MGATTSKTKRKRREASTASTFPLQKYFHEMNVTGLKDAVTTGKYKGMNTWVANLLKSGQYDGHYLPATRKRVKDWPIYNQLQFKDVGFSQTMQPIALYNDHAIFVNEHDVVFYANNKNGTHYMFGKPRQFFWTSIQMWCGQKDKGVVSVNFDDDKNGSRDMWGEIGKVEFSRDPATFPFCQKSGVGVYFISVMDEPYDMYLKKKKPTTQPPITQPPITQPPTQPPALPTPTQPPANSNSSDPVGAGSGGVSGSSGGSNGLGTGSGTGTGISNGPIPPKNTQAPSIEITSTPLASLSSSSTTSSDNEQQQVIKGSWSVVNYSLLVAGSLLVVLTAAVVVMRRNAATEEDEENEEKHKKPKKHGSKR